MRKHLFSIGFIFVILLSLLLIEGFLLIFGPGNCYHYGEWDRNEQLLRYQHWCDSIHYSNPEFEYGHRTNDIGFTDRRRLDEIDSSSHARVILALGDSYTQGVGATYEYSWPQQLENLMNVSSKEIRYIIYNAGVGGADPFFEYKNLKYLTDKVHPSIVILVINPSDYDEAYYRGGWERFVGETVQYRRRPPWWKVFYVKSAFIRLIVHSLGYNCMLTKDSLDMTIQEGQSLVMEAIDSIRSYAEQRNLPLIIVFHPIPRNGILTERENDMLLQKLSHDSNFINLTPIITEHHDSEYFWIVDRHCTSKGYALFAENIYNHILHLMPERCAGKNTSMKHPNLMSATHH